MMTLCLLGLGSNLGDRVAFLQQAVDAMRSWPQSQVLAVSPFLETEPIGGPEQQNPYLNAALLMETDLELDHLFELMQRLEQQSGRERRERWAARTLDLDLLLYGNLRVQRRSLTVPHPWMALRRFVLEPAVRIAPDFVHPEIGWTIDQLHRHLKANSRYIAVTGPDQSLVRQVVHGMAQNLGCISIEDPADSALVACDSLVPIQPGRFAEDPVECFKHRVARLSEARDTMQAAGQGLNERAGAWAVSDFWLDDLLDAGTMERPAVRQALMEAWYAARPTLWQPALVVLVLPGESTDGQRSSGETPLGDVFARPDVARLRARVRRPGRGPFLVLRTSDPRRLEHDLSAAMAAMG